jgi:hypothetical protein
MSDRPVPPTSDNWAFDDLCPECGEEVYLGAIVEETDDGDPVRAIMLCGERYYETYDMPGIPARGDDEQGCGHEWEWVADE